MSTLIPRPLAAALTEQQQRDDQHHHLHAENQQLRQEIARLRGELLRADWRIRALSEREAISRNWAMDVERRYGGQRLLRCTGNRPIPVARDRADVVHPPQTTADVGGAPHTGVLGYAAAMLRRRQ